MQTVTKQRIAGGFGLTILAVAAIIVEVLTTLVLSFCGFMGEICEPRQQQAMDALGAFALATFVFSLVAISWALRNPSAQSVGAVACALIALPTGALGIAGITLGSRDTNPGIVSLTIAISLGAAAAMLATTDSNRARGGT